MAVDLIVWWWCVGILFLIKRELSQHSSALQITVKGKTNAELIMKAFCTEGGTAGD